jgi:hypothetical protein
MNYCVEDGERSLLRKFHSRVIRGRDEFRNHSCTLAAQPSLASAQPRENQTHELTTNQMLGPSVAHPVVGSEKKSHVLELSQQRAEFLTQQSSSNP